MAGLPFIRMAVARVEEAEGSAKVWLMRALGAAAELLGSEAASGVVNAAACGAGAAACVGGTGDSWEDACH